MEEKKKMDKKDIYILVLIGLFYLCIYGKLMIGAFSLVTGWEWILFIILSVVALAICCFAWVMSFVSVKLAIEYFGLPKSYLVLTILSIIIGPLVIIGLILLLYGHL